MAIGSQVFLCADPGCNTGDTLLFDTTSLGTITPGQSVILAVVWEPDNDRFIFLRAFPVQRLIFNYADTLTDVDLPGIVHKRVELRADIENCATGPRAMGFMEVFVDQVFVNQYAVSP